MPGIHVDVQRDSLPAHWDDGVRACGGSVFQSGGWARYQQVYLGAVPYFVRGGDAQLLLFSEPRTGEGVWAGRSSVLRGIVAPLVSSLSWREGPLSPAADAEALAACMRGVDQIAGESGLAIAAAYLPLDRRTFEADWMVARGYEAAPAATVRIDLTRPLDEVWQALKQGVARTPVRKAERQGITVTEVTSEDGLRRYYALVREWRRANAMSFYPFEKFALMRELMPEMTALFLAEHDGEAIGGAGLWYFGGQAHYFTPAHAVAARERGLHAGDLLIWRMIEWCHARGIRSFDLTGIAPAPDSPKEAGIRRFKEKWGTVVDYSTFSRPGTAWWDPLVRRLHRGVRGAQERMAAGAARGA